MSKQKDFETVPLRLPVALDSKLGMLADSIGKTKQETMRLCLEIGAKWIESNDYDPTREVAAGPLLDRIMSVLNAATNRIERETREKDALKKLLAKDREPKARIRKR